MKPLSRYLALEARQDIPDGAGGYREDWVRRGYHWAAVEGRSGSGRAGEFGPVSSLSLRITIRDVPLDHPARPKPGERFVEQSRAYEVLAVHEGAPGFLTCFARESER